MAEISADQIVLDGKVSQLACPNAVKSKIGKLTVHSVDLPVSCLNDYKGGYFIGENALAQKESDAGDTWDSQALIFYDPTSNTLIWSLVTYSTFDTSIECDIPGGEKPADCPAGKIRCNKTESFKKWDSKTKTFVAFEFSGNTPSRKLKPFEEYSKNCK